VASLTKIMTCLTAIHIMDTFKLNPYEMHFFVHKNATKMKGTSANLKYGFLNNSIYLKYQKGESISLIDLLYAMMLPSGNDAATVIAEGLGLLILLSNRYEIFTKEYDLE